MVHLTLWRCTETGAANRKQRHISVAARYPGPQSLITYHDIRLPVPSRTGLPNYGISRAWKWTSSRSKTRQWPHCAHVHNRSINSSHFEVKALILVSVRYASDRFWRRVPFRAQVHKNVKFLPVNSQGDAFGREIHRPHARFPYYQPSKWICAREHCHDTANLTK